MSKLPKQNALTLLEFQLKTLSIKRMNACQKSHHASVIFKGYPIRRGRNLFAGEICLPCIKQPGSVFNA